MIDWSVEKSNLRFEEPIADRRRRILQRLSAKSPNSIREDWHQLGQIVNPDSRSEQIYQIQVSHHDHIIGYIILERSSGTSEEALFRLRLAIHDSAVTSDFIKHSMIRVAILGAQLRAGGKATKIIFEAKSPSPSSNPARTRDLSSNLKAMGFCEQDGIFIKQLSSPDSPQTIGLKKYLLEYVKAAPKVGRGYLLDVSRLSFSAVSALCDEYQEVAWGITNWARHSSIGQDELDMISKYVGGNRGLEIGAGSGRVTLQLLNRFQELTATDIVPAALDQIRYQAVGQKLDLSPLRLLVDDITETALPANHFDMVMFWENGLGAILDAGIRQRALLNMTKTLRVGGRLILGLRNLVSIPADQLMIAAQTDLVMGIYHTFTTNEVRDSLPGSMKLIAEHEGLPRPAGGRQFFLVFEKVSE